MSASPSSQLRVIMTFLSLPGAGSKMWTFESLRDGGWALDGMPLCVVASRWQLSMFRSLHQHIQRTTLSDQLCHSGGSPWGSIPRFSTNAEKSRQGPSLHIYSVSVPSDSRRSLQRTR